MSKDTNKRECPNCGALWDRDYKFTWDDPPRCAACPDWLGLQHDTVHEDPGRRARAAKTARGVSEKGERSFWSRVEEAEGEVENWPAWKKSAADRVFLSESQNVCMTEQEFVANPQEALRQAADRLVTLVNEQGEQTAVVSVPRDEREILEGFDYVSPATEELARRGYIRLNRWGDVKHMETIRTYKKMVMGINAFRNERLLTPAVESELASNYGFGLGKADPRPATRARGLVGGPPPMSDKPKLAKGLPSPRKLTDEDFERMDREAQELREAIEKIHKAGSSTPLDLRLGRIEGKLQALQHTVNQIIKSKL